MPERDPRPCDLSGPLGEVPNRQSPEPIRVVGGRLSPMSTGVRQEERCPKTDVCT
jgi:hypothetical protein